MSRWLTVLALSGALLASAALAQEPEATDKPAAPAAAEPAPDTAALNPLAALEKEQLSGFRDMPLFTPSRRRPAPPAAVVEAPPPPPPPPQAAPPAAPPEIKLAGVVEGPEGAVAIVENNGEIERLRLGDQVDGWLVTGLEGFTLKLTLDEREEEYRLFKRADAGAGTPASDDEDDEDAAPKARGKKKPAADDDGDE
jgi:hypothetical protein